MVAALPAPLDRELWVTTFMDLGGTCRRSELLSLRQLRKRLLETEADIKDKLPLIKLGQFGTKRTKAQSLRSDGNLNYCDGIECDYDGERISPEALADALRQHSLAGLVATSPSHRDDAPRCRLLLPCSRVLSPKDRGRMVSRVAGILPDELAPESWTLSQAYFLGRVTGATAHRVIEVDGDYVDLRPDLDATAKQKPAPPKRPKPARPKTNGAAHGNGLDHSAQGDLPLPDPDEALPVDVAAALDAIAAGDGSHDALVRLAGRWAAQGMSQADIVAALASALQRRPEAARDAGWHAAMADLSRLVAWAIEQEEAPPPPLESTPAAPPSPDDLDLDGTPSPTYSDDALALAFAERHADQLRYVAAWNQWLAWTGAVWQPDTTLRVFSRARLLLRQAAAACKKRRVAAGLAASQTVAAVERLSRADRRLAATVAQWDVRASVLNTPAGLVDLRTGELHPHRLEEYASKITAVAPDTTGAGCPAWLAFLDRITGGDKELQAFLQRIAGYCLTGDTSEHALFFAYGTGGNGKGTFLNTLTRVLGDYAAVASMETFTASATDRHPADLAMLRGARFVTSQETEQGRRWAESKINTLTGGDPITARFMRQDFFTYTPQFKLFIAGNHKPGLRSVNEAIRRRMNLIPFSVTIPAHERDRRLGRKLRTEWPGILRWAIEGCLEWQRIGLAPPAVVTSATEEYLADEDLVQAWISECCTADRAKRSYNEALYGSFRAWAELAGEHVQSQRWLSGALADRGYRQGRETRTGPRRDQRITQGLVLRSGAGVVPP